MVSSENRTGLYVSVPVYFVLLAGAAFWAYRKMENMEHNQTADKLAAHYLGGRDFGPLLTAGTLFASLFSGYTVIGVPNEAFRSGWKSLRWMAAVVGLVTGFFGTGMRLRKASLLRNHQSPLDFLTDRYQSQTLRYTILIMQLFPTVIYLAAQVIAIKGTFNSIFELNPDAAAPVIIIMGVILVFEWMGGLNSVALTDSIQAIVMVLSFVILPSVAFYEFGGWQDLDPATYPKPQYYQTLSKESQWDFWQFSLVNFGFFTLPHLMQRTYAAKDLTSLKMGYAVMTIGPWFTLFVGIFLGTVGVAVLVDQDGNPENPSDPFSAILEAIMNTGGFAKAAGCVAVTASLAAIMSTADSLIIAISQLITVEIVYPLKPDATPNQVALVGKAVSLGATIVAVVVGLFWSEGISDLGKIQFSISAQALPAYLFGLFSTTSQADMHPWCLATGALAGLIFVVSFYWGYVKPVSDSLPIDAGIMGFLINLVLSVTLDKVHHMLSYPLEEASTPDNKAGMRDDQQGRPAQMLCPGRPEWDIPKLDRFGGGCLSPELIWKSMEGVEEVLTNPSWCGMMLLVVTFATPLAPESQPPLAYNDDGSSFFVTPPSVINGLPWWAFKTIIVCIIPTLILLVAIYRMPSEYPVDVEQIEKEGLDVSLVEMTREELCRRTSYDEPNMMIQRRRSTISQTMDELGLKTSVAEPLEFAPTPSQRRLAFLALQNSTRVMDVSTPRMNPLAEEDKEEVGGGAFGGGGGVSETEVEGATGAV
eukprot:Nitzschia sp. Nitz4//NODE_159_length_47236_cov_74.723851//36053//38332//NITZ4_additional_000014-RA//-1//CDS//3329531761//1//frame0